MPQPLNAKDQANFRQLVRLYEAKQYKKALKTADGILKKNAGHGETEAMKALVLNSQGHADEAFALGKQALQHDMKSHITWHVYGLLWRSVKNYDESIRAYKMALKIEPESAQILRDLAFQQVQQRDYTGYIASRKQMLQSKPTIRQNWTALAVAYHLAGQLSTAEEMLKTYEDTLKQTPLRTDVEHSEAVMYKNQIIEESGDYERALEHLDTIYKTNLDRTAVIETRARLLLKLERKEEAAKYYRELLDRNNEYRFYYEQLELALGLDRKNSSDHAKLVELYESYARDRGDAATRIPLDFLTGEQFKAAADKYLGRMLRKGVPSTFTNVKGLYADDEKRATIFQLVEGYAKDAGSNDQTNGDKPDRLKEATLFFLLQHYNYLLTRDLNQALKYADEINALVPKNVVYIQAKARIYKHLGNTSKAAELMEEARQADEKDRYINTKCAKYQLRNGQNDLAIKTMSKFTRNEAVGGALGDLHDMQCMWFITEDGESYSRQNKLGLALKRFKAIYDIFDVWNEDQFDFHFFSIRKGPIRAYVDLIRWEDRLREHPFYSRTAIQAVQIYVKLHDNPDAGNQSSNIPGFDKMDAAEKKKALKRQKKEQEKAEKLEAERRELERKKASNAKKEDGETKKIDLDPNGTKLVETKTPLEDALPYVRFLLEFSPKSIEAQFAGFDVHVRRRKLVLALKALRAAHELDPKHPGLLERLVLLRKALFSHESSNAKVTEVLKAQSSFVPSLANLETTVADTISKQKSSPLHFFGALRARAGLDAQSQPQNEKDLLSVFDTGNVSLDDAAAGLRTLRDWSGSEEVRGKYKEAARKQYPEADIFAADKQQS